ncbi:hypothetical protein BDN70DRAFT_886452 [Pholiota conissans]|uniref:Uncharacterized protein n=1 Tax=Pholiota conissans TaxID=109636 RepID=A0A9P6CNI6_9AGAR|nr:hypothetical protein BDN70DRAFT_886452 [Pholiota conissans]
MARRKGAQGGCVESRHSFPILTKYYHRPPERRHIDMHHWAHVYTFIFPLFAIHPSYSALLAIAVAQIICAPSYPIPSTLIMDEQTLIRTPNLRMMLSVVVHAII